MSKNKKPSFDIDALATFSIYNNKTNKVLKVEGPLYIVEQYKRLANVLGDLAQAKYFLTSVCEPSKLIPSVLTEMTENCTNQLFNMIEEHIVAGQVYELAVS